MDNETVIQDENEIHWDKLGPKDKVKLYLILGIIGFAIALIVAALLGAAITQWNIAIHWNCTMLA
jgi:hypothetical protein